MMLARQEEDFFGKKSYLTVSGQLGGGDLCLCAFQCLHLWADLPRGEFEYLSPCIGVLDD
jgi:hypothetical protein